MFQQLEVDQNVFEVAIDGDKVTVKIDEVISALGYAEGAIPQHFREVLEEIMHQIDAHCTIQAGYRIVDVKTIPGRNDALTVGGIPFELKKIVTGCLHAADRAALFACTIGPVMETWVKEITADGDIMRRYLIDTVASTLAEEVTDQLHDHIGQCMQQHGLRITNRYSPGYCDWSVAEQQKLFSLLPNNFCGITLTDSSLMIPIKSVSGIIGIGTSVKRLEYFCDTCGMKECTYRAYHQAKAGHTVSPPEQS